MIKIVNQELYNRYTEFLKESLILLNDFLNKGDRIPYVVYDFFEPTDSGWSDINRREKSYSRFIEMHKTDVVNLPYFIKLIDVMVQDTTLRNKLHGILINENDPVTLPNVDTIFISNWIMPIIESFVERNQSFVFNDRLCDDLYKKYEDFFYKSERDLNPIAPLHNFESEMEVILLDENFKIRKICEDEQKKLYREDYSMIPKLDVIFINFMLECRYEVEAHRPDEMQYIKESFDKVISAMRLFKKGTFGYNRITIKQYSACPVSKASMSSGKNYYEPYRGTQYNLSKDEVEGLVKFWEAYKDVNFEKNRFIELAVRRFNLSHIRKDLEDKLIDMMIAFEALYLTDNAELSYKLATRAAFILGIDKKKSEQKEIYLFLKKAYAIRSQIVHGSKHLNQNKIELSKNKEISVQEFILQLEDYLRQSILHFMSLSMELNGKKRKNYLDQIMFN